MSLIVPYLSRVSRISCWSDSAMIVWVQASARVKKLTRESGHRPPRARSAGSRLPTFEPAVILNGLIYNLPGHHVYTTLESDPVVLSLLPSLPPFGTDTKKSVITADMHTRVLWTPH